MTARPGFTTDVTHRFVVKTIRRHLRQYASARRECPTLAELRRGRVEGALSVAYITDLITSREYERFNVLADRITAARITRGTQPERIAA
jgi:hypothetical protein